MAKRWLNSADVEVTESGSLGVCAVGRTPHALAVSNPSAGDANAKPLAAEPTAYRQASVFAPAGNSGTVYVVAVGGNTASAFPLPRGTSRYLPDGCDLADFRLIVDTGGDGVVVEYST
ncbi:MAG: hypothetical protein ACP5HU_10395 [Phycisphaerae bacterium]